MNKVIARAEPVRRSRIKRNVQMNCRVNSSTRRSSELRKMKNHDALARSVSLFLRVMMQRPKCRNRVRLFL
jgi:hypothetical protein